MPEPQRTCYACGQTDDSPRLTEISSLHDPSQDRSYHYDCAPSGLLASQGINARHAAMVAVNKGLQNDDLRAAILSSNLVPKGA